MARIFITGSTDGLGKMAATLLISQGHHVVLHARNAVRKKDALKAMPTAEEVLIADLSDLAETKKLAAEVNALGSFDAVIHNAGVYQVSDKQIFAVNTLAPYILTCLIQKPKRLVYLSSGMHLQGHPALDEFLTNTNRISYSDSKLHVLMLAKAVARKWPTVLANALDPGWVPTKMGGASAPDNLEKGFQTQTWLAVSSDPQTQVSGQYFYHQKQKQYSIEADNINGQDKFLTLCEQISGVSFPA